MNSENTEEPKVYKRSSLNDEYRRISNIVHGEVIEHDGCIVVTPEMGKYFAEEGYTEMAARLFPRLGAGLKGQAKTDALNEWKKKHDEREELIIDCITNKKLFPHNIIFESLLAVWDYPSDSQKIGLNYFKSSFVPDAVGYACYIIESRFQEARRILGYTAYLIDPEIDMDVKLGLDTLEGIYKPSPGREGANFGLEYPKGRWTEILDTELFEKLNKPQFDKLTRLNIALNKLVNLEPKQETADSPQTKPTTKSKREYSQWPLLTQKKVMEFWRCYKPTALNPRELDCFETHKRRGDFPVGIKTFEDFKKCKDAAERQERKDKRGKGKGKRGQVK